MKAPAEESKSTFAAAEIDKDCPICMYLMVEPVQITCGHHFCVQCIQAFRTNKP